MHRINLMRHRKKLDENQAKIDQSKQQLKDGEAQLSAARSQLNEKKAQLNASQAQLDDGKRQIEDAKQKLEDGQKQIEDAKATIAKMRKSLQKANANTKRKKAKAEKKIAKAEKKIDDAQKEVDDIKEPEWTVEDRSDLLEYTNYGDNAERMKSIGEVFPVLFLPGGSPDQSDHDDANGRRRTHPDRNDESTRLQQGGYCGKISAVCTVCNTWRQCAWCAGRRENIALYHYPVLWYHVFTYEYDMYSI